MKNITILLFLSILISSNKNQKYNHDIVKIYFVESEKKYDFNKIKTFDDLKPFKAIDITDSILLNSINKAKLVDTPRNITKRRKAGFIIDKKGDTSIVVFAVLPSSHYIRNLRVNKFYFIEGEKDFEHWSKITYEKSDIQALR